MQINPITNSQRNQSFEKLIYLDGADLVLANKVKKPRHLARLHRLEAKYFDNRDIYVFAEASSRLGARIDGDTRYKYFEQSIISSPVTFLENVCREAEKVWKYLAYREQQQRYYAEVAKYL